MFDDICLSSMNYLTPMASHKHQNAESPLNYYFGAILKLSMLLPPTLHIYKSVNPLSSF